MAEFGKVTLEGYEELRRDMRRAKDVELPKRMGQAHKQVGEWFISEKLRPSPDPAAVGEGAGSAVKPSASKREVLLRVGGAHRAASAPRSQWGKRRVAIRGRRAPERPYIRQSVEDNREAVESEFLHAISGAMSGAFHEVDPR